MTHLPRVRELQMLRDSLREIVLHDDVGSPMGPVDSLLDYLVDVLFITLLPGAL